MTHVTCRPTAKNRDQLRNRTLGNRVGATFFARCMDDQMLKFGGGRVSIGGFAAETENSAR